MSNQISVQPKKRGSAINISAEYNEILNCYTISLEQSESTKVGKAAIIRRYFKFLQANGKTEITETNAYDLKQFLLETMKSYGSRQHLISVLRDFHKYALVQGLIQFDYENAIFVPAAPYKRVLPCFSHNELDCLLSSIDTRVADGKRDYAIILLASRTGLRTIDVANMKLPDVDWKHGEISVVQQKTAQPLVLPVEQEVLYALDDYIKNGRPPTSQEYVFIRCRAPYQRFNDGHAIGSMFRRRLNKAGLHKENGDGRSVHALRRTLGTRMTEADVPLTTISQVLGHRSVDSAKQYLSLDCTNLKKCSLSLSGIAVSRKELM